MPALVGSRLPAQRLRHTGTPLVLVHRAVRRLATMPGRVDENRAPPSRLSTSAHRDDHGRGDLNHTAGNPSAPWHHARQVVRQPEANDALAHPLRIDLAHMELAGGPQLDTQRLGQEGQIGRRRRGSEHRSPPRGRPCVTRKRVAVDDHLMCGAERQTANSSLAICNTRVTICSTGHRHASASFVRHRECGLTASCKVQLQANSSTLAELNQSAQSAPALGWSK